MKNLLFTFALFSFFCSVTTAQEITETNTDVIYQKALEFYKTGNFKYSLQLTRRGLDLAPEYHDIRILQIRNLWALENFSEADKELKYLLSEAPEYIDVKPLVQQRINKYKDNTEALKFLSTAEISYPADKGLKIKKAQLLLAEGERKEARSIAMDLIASERITGAQRYDLQIILNRSITDEVGVSYQFINFSNDYSHNDPWHSVSAEYQHNFNRTAVILKKQNLFPLDVNYCILPGICKKK